MKTLLIVILALLVCFVVFQAFVSRDVGKTEEQRYKLIVKDGDFEIRYYPEAVMATVAMQETGYGRTSGMGFRKLAGYIFGGNQKQESIAMTSPVHMSMSDSGSSMSFVMPSAYSMNDLPAPNDNTVQLHKQPAEYTASITYGGFNSDKKIAENKARLLELLAKKGIQAKGECRVLGYDPPYKVTDRKNEVIISIEYKESN